MTILIELINIFEKYDFFVKFKIISDMIFEFYYEQHKEKLIPLSLKIFVEKEIAHFIPTRSFEKVLFLLSGQTNFFKNQI